MAIAGRDAFPNSRGGKHCHNLVAQIEQKSINIQTESIWNAPWPELSVAYRNITEVHFRLVPADWNKLREKNFRLSSKEERQALLKMEPVKSWRHDLPPTADYKQRTELFTVPDDVKPGFYFLISSADASFRENNNQTQTATVWISDLSLVVRPREQTGSRASSWRATPASLVPGAQVDAWLLGNRGKYVKKNGCHG